MSKLPIETILPMLKETLALRANAVLVAAPGAGKTTRIPIALLDEPWLKGRRILMLEPRRLAARSAARFMAASLGQQVGETVGYRVRLDTRVGAQTRIEVITEGVLTRMLQEDPALEDVGIVIFDEFHERSLHADLSLALCLESQAVLREDLRIMVMSATLEAEPAAQLLGGAPILVSEGRSFPVETHYLKRRFEGRIEPIVVQAIVNALESDHGDILAFLPGFGEIRRVEARLRELRLPQTVRIAPLYGNLPQEDQDSAIAPSPDGERKIVLATSIAETSITVEGVRIVIDSGLMRVPRFSPRTGMTRLETVAVSRSSADQRRGRAGRLGPGVCCRLWSMHDDRNLADRGTPEILEADLAPLALELAAWGVSDPAELSWLDPPPAAAYQQARELLQQLGATGEDGAITSHGRRMAELGLHPRLAHMVLKATGLKLGRLACTLAALLFERDILRSAGSVVPDADLRHRLETIRAVEAGKYDSAKEHGSFADLAACRRILNEAHHLQRMLGCAQEQQEDYDACGLLLAFAYPDRIGQRRELGRFLLRSGRRAFFGETQPLSNTPYLVAAELDDQGADSRIFLAAPIELEELKLHFSDQVEQQNLVVWDRSAQAVRSRQCEKLGAIVLKDVPLSKPEPEELLSALLKGVAEEGLGILPWKRNARQFRQRLLFMHRLASGWPDVSDDALAANLSDWLAPHVYGMKSREDLQSLNLAAIFEAMLSWEQRRALDEGAPTHIVVPSGSRIAVDYSDPASPVLAVRLQEMFGLKETPRIGWGRISLTLHLLSPAHRPVQVTQDLASFWQHAYFEVKKDLKGRYPKHHWPDDPISAIPTNRARPRT